MPAGCRSAPSIRNSFPQAAVTTSTRKIDGNPRLEAEFAWLLSLARRVRAQGRGQRGPKVYSLHAPEVEYIGKGKPHKPYEFGVKVSVATTLKHSKGGQFVAHAQALPAIPMTAIRWPR
jgi:IS5 family transposase